MNSKRDVTISSKATSVDRKSRSPVPAKENLGDGEENADRSTKSQRTPRSQLLELTRHAKSASPSARDNCPQGRRKARSPSPGKGRSREFLTGLDYRTKFMREISFLNDKTSVGTMQNRTRRPTSVPVGVNNRSVKPASKAVENAPVRRARVARSLSTTVERPREFLTGVDYRTKFMRKLSYEDAALKSRHNSGDSKTAHPTKMDAGKANQCRQLKPKTSLLKIPLRKEVVKKPTEVRPNLTQTVPNRKTSQLSTSTAEVKTTLAIGNSGDKVKGNNGKNPPSGGAQKTPETTKAGTTRLRQSRTKSNATKAKVCLAQSGETATKTSGSIRLSPALKQVRNNSIDLGIPDNYFMQGINKNFDLSINIPRSPISEPTGSNSLHTTPRSPRFGQRHFTNSFLRLDLPTSATSSIHSEQSLPLSETLEMQRASSPLAKVSWPSKAHSHSKKGKFLPMSDNTLVYRSLGSFTNARRSKTTATKQEPIGTVFNAQFVPVVKWTSKTKSDDIFEPLYRQGSKSPPNLTNSNANPADGDKASHEKSAECKLSNQTSKETGNRNDNVVLDERCVKRPQLQTTANEGCDIPHPSRMHVSANVRRTNKKSMTQKSAFSKKADRNLDKNRVTPVKPAWKLTGPQQIVSGCSPWSPTSSPLPNKSHEAWKLTGSQQITSGCSLWSPTPSPLPKRPESVKDIATTNMPAVYTTSTKWPVGDFAMRPRSAAVNKKPVWK